MEEIEEEIWKECGESKRCTYFVSNIGRVKRVTKKNKIEKVLRGGLNRDGYLHVVINKTRLVHHLVVYAFIGPRPEGLEIDHIDRNKLNNRADNLRYVTRTENNINKDCYREDILTNDPKERNKIFCKEYQEANRETILEKKKEYYEANKETLSEKAKEYYEANKETILEKVTCECGSIVRKGAIARHKRSKKHQDFVQNNL